MKYRKNIDYKYVTKLYETITFLQLAVSNTDKDLGKIGVTSFSIYIAIAHELSDDVKPAYKELMMCLVPKFNTSFIDNMSDESLENVYEGSRKLVKLYESYCDNLISLASKN